MSITFMCLIVGEGGGGGGGGGGVLGGGKLQILRKKPSSSFGYYRSMTSAPLSLPQTHTHTYIFRNLDNFLPGALYSTIRLGTEE